MNPLLIKHLREVKKICKQHKVVALYVFGSVCTEKFNENSDIDFLITFAKMPLRIYADNYFGLEDSLSALLGRKVDVVVEKTLKNPYFINVMGKTKTLIYDRRRKKISA